MQNCFIFIEKANNRIACYGSVKELFQIEGENIEIEKGSFYNKTNQKKGAINLNLEDYEDNHCRIAKRSIIRSKHSQLL